MSDRVLAWLISGIGGALEILRQQVAERDEIPGVHIGHINTIYEELTSIIDDMDKKKV